MSYNIIAYRADGAPVVDYCRRYETLLDAINGVVTILYENTWEAKFPEEATELRIVSENRVAAVFRPKEIKCTAPHR